jgi:hypothetical protein
MVYPVNNIVFKIGTAGPDSDSSQMATVADMQTFAISFDNGVSEWKPLDQGGWSRRLVTSKSVTISLSGKRNYGDPGNDFVAGMAYKNGGQASTVLEILFPDGSSLRMVCVINVSASDGGDASDVSELKFECMSDGKPVYTAANSESE